MHSPRCRILRAHPSPALLARTSSLAEDLECRLDLEDDFSFVNPSVVSSLAQLSVRGSASARRCLCRSIRLASLGGDFWRIILLEPGVLLRKLVARNCFEQCLLESTIGIHVPWFCRQQIQVLHCPQNEGGVGLWRRLPQKAEDGSESGYVLDAGRCYPKQADSSFGVMHPLF